MKVGSTLPEMQGKAMVHVGAKSKSPCAPSSPDTERCAQEVGALIMGGKPKERMALCLSGHLPAPWVPFPSSALPELPAGDDMTFWQLL